MKSRPFIIPIFVAHLGCPHRCVFCNQHVIAGASNRAPSPSWVQNRIRTFLEYKGKKRGKTEVAFFGGNFLRLSRSYRISLMDAVSPFLEEGTVDGIRFSTRPDSFSAKAMASVMERGVTVVEVGAQSMVDDVLAGSQRGHDAKATENAVALLRSFPVEVGLQLMPGLPGDAMDTIRETGRLAARLKPDFVRIYPTVVVKGTVLEKWFRDGVYTPLSLDEAVEVTKYLYHQFTDNGISVIRMGLHADDSLVEPGNVVAGPFHPAFGHLVHSAIFFDRASSLLEQQTGPLEKVILRVHPHRISRLKGDRGLHIKRLCRRFSIETLKVVADTSLPLEEIVVDTNT